MSGDAALAAKRKLGELNAAAKKRRTQAAAGEVPTSPQPFECAYEGMVPAPPVLTPQDAERIEKNRHRAEQLRERARAIAAINQAPSDFKTRPGAKDQPYMFQNIDSVIGALQRALPFGYSFEILDTSQDVYNDTPPNAVTGAVALEKAGRVPADSGFVIVARSKVRITIGHGDTKVVYEARGSSVMKTTDANRFVAMCNAEKAADSDALKRAARLIGPVFSSAPSPSPGPAHTKRPASENQ